MTKNDFDMLVAEIESRMKGAVETIKSAAAGEMAALHEKVDALHTKVEAMAAPPPAPRLVTQPVPKVALEPGEPAA